MIKTFTIKRLGEKMRVILNADDYGCSPEANEAIRYCFEKGYCTQASLMTNFGAVTDEAVAIAKANGFDDKLGVHINFTAGSPLSEEIKRVSVYVCNEKFIDPYDPKYKSSIHKLLPLHINKIRGERRRQIEKYLSYDLSMMHCDFHYSIQQDLPIWLAIRPLLDEYGFKTVRGLLYKPCYSNMYKKYTELLGLIYNSFKGARADVAVSVAGYDKYSKIKDLNNKVVEVFSHPTVIDGKYIDNYTGGKLMSETVGGFLEENKDSIQIITYSDLVQ